MADARAEDTHHGAAASGRTKEDSGRTTVLSLDDGAAPDPAFTSNLAGSPTVCMDPIRLEYYRSLGFVAGLAVRTRVPLPLPRLAPRWWMLVAEDKLASEGLDSSSEASGQVPPAACMVEAKRSEASEGRGPSSSCLRRADPRLKTSFSSVDGVLAALRRLGEGGAATTGQQRPDDTLADARFVGPLSSGKVVELSPGGERNCQSLEVLPLTAVLNVRMFIVAESKQW